MMIMALAAATTILGVPLRAPETVFDAASRRTWRPLRPLRGSNNASQLFAPLRFLSLSQNSTPFRVLCCLPSPPLPKTPFNRSTKLFVSGLSFRTTEESLRNAFKNFGQLLEVNLVMDKRAKRPKGFAFIRYATEEESQKAIEGMHGKFLDGRVIFVEVAKSRSELRQNIKQNRRLT